MIDKALQILAPDHCFGCGKTGTNLCDDCKYDITSEPYEACLWCGQLNINGMVCATCCESCVKAWAVGERSDTLARMIDSYKFQHRRTVATGFAQLLDSTLPDLPADTIVTWVPTARAHIRQRSFDHARRIAEAFANQRKLTSLQLLQRVGNERQLGASRKQRFEQAKRAFAATDKPIHERPVLLIDDVFTTGASLQYASQKLRESGVETIWAAVIARQPLDQTEKI